MRRAIAEHMVRSVQSAPHVTTCFEIDMTGVARAREAAQRAFRAREGFELTYLPFFARAVVESLRQHPVVNASYEVGESGQAGIRRPGGINLGVAMGLENGLVVPVVRDADGLSVVGIARAVRALVERARAGKLTLEDVRGGTSRRIRSSTAGRPLSSRWRRSCVARSWCRTTARRRSRCAR
jgi:pyruvate/2-oxoglutarate dehydrogenase complex dihydrolipoamide acyltransferase (E2) component